MTMTAAVTKFDLYAMAQNAIEDGRPEVAEDCLRRARMLALTMNNKKASVDQAEAALRLARLYRHYATREASNAMYDEAFIVYAQTLGEAHATTLDVQREYGTLLTTDAILDATRARRTN